MTPNFSRSEMACADGCGFDTCDVKLAEVLEVVRSHFDSPVRINSGCRCKEHNENVGGSKSSQHLYGKAADIVVHGVSPAKVYQFLNSYLENGGLGKYETFTHVDVRDIKARW